MPRLQGLEDGRKLVAPDVAQTAGPEIPPAAPGERMIARVIRAHGGGADPQVPVQVRRHRRRLLGARDAARGDHWGAVRAAVDLADRAARPGPDRLSDQPGLFARLALVAH